MFPVVLMAGLLALAADAPPKVTYVGHDKVAAAISKGGPLVASPDLTVTGSHREKAGQVEVQRKRRTSSRKVKNLHLH